MKKILLSILTLCLISGCSRTENKHLIYRSENFSLYRDSVSWGSYSARIISTDEIRTTYFKDKIWKRSHDISHYPVFTSDIPLLNAMHAMSLEELEKLKTDEGLFNTGALWGGVWTRDYSESTILALAYITPDIAKRALLRKTKNGMIIQDTGTGGSWPVSTDRMIWSIAAMEIYKVTGDKQWLDTIYSITRKSVERDQLNVFAASGLAYGETTTMDWRENSYPSWMKAPEIFQSLSLSTNAVHYQTYALLAEMAKKLNKPSEEYEKIAVKIKDNINKSLWIDSLGYYGEYLYGKNFPVLSARSDGMGEALCVLFDIAGPGQKKSILEKTPVLEYGVPLFYPFKPDAFAYHNNTVWPYVQAMWNLAAAKEKNEEVLCHGLAAIYRSAALFLSNKENFVASTGDALGTAMNSDRQLWSVAANLAMTYRVFAGMQFEDDHLAFHPVISGSYHGKKQISNFRYRDAILDITIDGYGTEIRSFSLDGTEQKTSEIPASLSGNHKIGIVMADNDFAGKPINIVSAAFSPQEPSLHLNWENGLYWNTTENDKEYRVYENGKLISKQSNAFLPVLKDGPYKEYQVEVLGKNGQVSFLSNPVICYNDSLCVKLECENYAPASGFHTINFSGKGFVETTTKINTAIRMDYNITKPGRYLASMRYANGNGQMCCLDKCGVRSFIVDGKNQCSFLFPIVEDDNWIRWFESNSTMLDLSAGKHVFEISYLPSNENMNVTDNMALLDYLSLIRIGD